MVNTINNNNIKIVIIGATGSVGRELINTLKPHMQMENLTCIASCATDINGIPVHTMDEKYLQNIDYAIFTATEEISSKYCALAKKYNFIAIDNTPAFRMEPNVPLVIPEINMPKSHDSILASPNCVAIGVSMSIKNIHKNLGVLEIIASTYQAVSGAGKNHTLELIDQTKNAMQPDNIKIKYFQKPILYNILPIIGELNENGISSEEQKVLQETNKIFNSNIKIQVQCTRVPTIIGHGISIFIKTEKDATEKEIIEILKTDSDIQYEENPYNATCQNVINNNKVIVSRVRKTSNNNFILWSISNNVKKGAALNILQIISKISNVKLC